MTAKEFVKKAILAATAKTAYIKGGFGYTMTPKNKQRVIDAYSFNKKRADTINTLSADTFGFDCICLVKSILWGWNGDTAKEYGGAVYKSNGVPDSTIEAVRKKCSSVSSDFSRIQPGEILFSGTEHVGIYIGNGFAVEATTAYSKQGGVFLSKVDNLGTEKCGNHRTWECHGFLPYVEYTEV